MITIECATLAIGVDLLSQGNAFGPIAFVLIYGAYLMAMGIFTFTKGYTLGTSVLSKITDKKIMAKITDILSILGLTVAGAMIANNVVIATPLTFTVSGSTVVVQELLDAILPDLLGVIAVVNVFLGLKKGTSVLKIMMILFAVAVVCSLVGIL